MVSVIVAVRDSKMTRKEYEDTWNDLEYIANKLESVVFYDKSFVGKKIDQSQKRIESIIGQMSTGPNWHRKRS